MTSLVRVRPSIIRFVLSRTSCLSRARVSERRLETFVRLLLNEPSRLCRSCSAQRCAERNERVLIATLECADSVHVSLLQPLNSAVPLSDDQCTAAAASITPIGSKPNVLFEPREGFRASARNRLEERPGGKEWRFPWVP